jgi:F-type H+-transporting ATPase subunit b
MISVDWSIIPAIIIFLIMIVALNYLLFRPVTRIQAERENRTSGLMSQTRQDLAHQMHLFDQFQATIKNARMEGYRLIDKARSEALLRRSAAMDQARNNAEQLMRMSRESIRNQVTAAKARLEGEAQEMARGIASAILHRSA